MQRSGVVLILVLAFAGLSNALYLAQHAENGTPLLCDVQNLSGCNIVAASEYSRFLGIPLAEYGVAFYAALFILAAVELALFNRFMRRVIQVVTVIGVVLSLYFSSLQLFVINAFCIYCLASALIALLALACASYIEPLREKQKTIPPPAPPPASHLTMPPTA